MTRNEQIREASQKEMMKHPNFHISAPAFRMGAEWADANPSWVSVGDELPKENGRYLFYHPAIGVQLAYYYNDLMLDKAVTHWMPLPVPPKKGGQQ